MDTQEINSALNSNQITRNAFVGTFACDKLPETIERIPFATVVNTDVQSEPGAHWIAIYLPSWEEPIEYFDSYGEEPTNDYIVKFLDMVEEYSYNNRRVQNIFSASCGQHCIYFITKRCQNVTFNKIMNSYSYNSHGKNDKMVEEFCKKNVGFKTSKTELQGFLIRQISRQLIEGLQ